MGGLQRRQETGALRRAGNQWMGAKVSPSACLACLYVTFTFVFFFVLGL